MRKLSIFFIALLFFASCEKEPTSPEIEWQGGINIRYSYSGGALSGITATTKFVVISDFPGEVEVMASGGGEEVTFHASVDPGETYIVNAKAGISSPSNSGVMYISSPSAERRLTVSADKKLIARSIKFN
jgi:hypothetical protein